MNYQHKNLAACRWEKFSLIEQMANIGSEVERALNWQQKHNAVYAQQALERALELVDLTLDNLKSFARLKEITRIRDAIADFFMGNNEYGFTPESLRKYFFCFMYAARKNC